MAKAYLLDGEVMVPTWIEDGGELFFKGVRVGIFRGDIDVPGGWYIDTVPTKDMPPEFAEAVKAVSTMAESSARLVEIVGREARFEGGAFALVPEGVRVELVGGDPASYRLCLDVPEGERQYGCLVLVGRTTMRDLQDVFGALRQAMVRRQQHVAGVD